MDFEQRLQKAAERGQKKRDAKSREEAAKAMSEEECKRLHSKLRLDLTDHIESCLKQLADQFPGFNYKPVMDEKGWGSAVARDDLGLSGGTSKTYFSRLEMVVSPFNQYHVLDLVAKGTVRNKEIYTRNHYELLSESRSRQLLSYHRPLGARVRRAVLRQIVVVLRSLAPCWLF